MASLGTLESDGKTDGSDITTVLLVGRSGFIGSEFTQTRVEGISTLAVSHQGMASLGPDQSFDVVLNSALHPNFKSAPYDAGYDADLAAAHYAKKIGAHFVMLSTRRAYASNHRLRTISEEEPPAPDTPYGSNKLESERRVSQLLGDRCTILRISNVFGFEPGRPTFLGLAVTSLQRERRVILDVSPFVQRDFIPVATLCQMLGAIIRARPSGVFNVGAGFGVPIGQIALWLLKGYGPAELVVNCPDERDAFVLDIRKLKLAVPACPSVGELEPVITAIGRSAKDAQHSTTTPIREKTKHA